MARGPARRPELQHLGRGAVRVRGPSLGVSGYLTAIVDGSGLAVVATEWFKRRHDPVMPDETKTDKVGAKSAEVLAVGIGDRGFGRARNLYRVVQVGKRLAVWSPQRTQVNHRPFLDYKGMLNGVAGQRGKSVYLSVVVDAIGQAEAASQRAQVGDGVVSKLVCFMELLVLRDQQSWHCQRSK